MRKRKGICALALALTLLTSCGGPEASRTDSGRSGAQQETAQNDPDPETPEDSGVPPVPLEGEPVISASRGAMLAAYTAVLNGFYYDHTDHTGQDLGYMEDFDEAGNRFAVYDVDRDGQDELIVIYTTTYTAGTSEYVLGYNETDGSIKLEFTGFPLTVYYDNGVIEAGWSHSQGRAGDALWPYTFWRYDAQADAYRPAEMADAWDKALVEDGFPDSADKDGDGVVYYLIEYGNYVDYGSDTPVDKSGYNLWRESFIGGADVLEVPYVTLNEENIKSIR